MLEIWSYSLGVTIQRATDTLHSTFFLLHFIYFHMIFMYSYIVLIAMYFCTSLVWTNWTQITFCLVARHYFNNKETLRRFKSMLDFPDACMIHLHHVSWHLRDKAASAKHPNCFQVSTGFQWFLGFRNLRCEGRCSSARHVRVLCVRLFPLAHSL